MNKCGLIKEKEKKNDEQSFQSSTENSFLDKRLKITTQIELKEKRMEEKESTDDNEKD